MLKKRLAQLAFGATIVTAGFLTPTMLALPIMPMATPSTPLTATQKPSIAQAQVWNLKNADIHAVIQTVSELTHKDFIVDPRVTGNVTLISQSPMSPDEMYQVFLSMLQLLQFAAIPSGNVVKIVPAMDANALSRQIATAMNPGNGDEIVVRVVPVSHVSATELVPVLRPLMSQSGTITAYLPSNALILAGSASNINRLVQVIHQMDSTNMQQISMVTLRYANAKNVAAMIHSLQSGNASQGNGSQGSLVPDEDNNSILINATMPNELIIKNLIRELDQPGSGGDDTRVVNLNYLSAKTIAPILAKVAQGISASAAASGQGGPQDQNNTAGNDKISIQAEDSTNAIIIHAPRSLLRSILKVIHKLDSRPEEVLVEAIIVRVDENLLNKLGIVWGTSDGGVGAATAGITTALPSATIAADNVFALNANHQFGFLPDGNLIAILHALKTNGSSDVLSTPSVAVLNNEKATISDGQNIGVANRSYQGIQPATAPGATEITPYNTIQRTNVALSLNVTPHISPNNMIRMDLLQSDDTVAPSINPGANDENPTINTTKIKTSVLVRSGDILVLGGLIDNEEEKSKEKLPFLGDLPLIGHLFRYDSHTMDKKNLMVFIRPIIMSNGAAKAQTLHRYAYIRHKQIEVATEHIAEEENLPLLPRLSPDTNRLPPPLASALPNPTTTELYK